MKAEHKIIFRCCEHGCYMSNGDDGEGCEIAMPNYGVMVGGNGLRYPMNCPWLAESRIECELVEGTHERKGQASFENPIRDKKCVN